MIVWGLQADPGSPPATAKQTPITKSWAELRTDRGMIRIELYPAQAPLTVANFINLARRGFYDGLIFHRVIAGATVEGGCPLGKGIAGPGYKFEDEFHPKLRHDAPGMVSMANVGPDTNGSRFQITLRAVPALDHRSPVFGKVIEGLAVARSIRSGDVIRSIVIKGPAPKFPDRVQERVRAWNQILQKHRSDKTPTPQEAPANDNARE